MGRRWKGKEAETKSLSNPISRIISQLQCSLILSNSRGLLMGSYLLLEADAMQTELLNRACFGRPCITGKDKQWFELSMEEGFYLCYVLKCIKVAENHSEMNDEKLWFYASANRENFPKLFEAYSHLWMKNSIVRSGSQYGVDFVAYRHHPSLVHSEYAVLVLSGDDGEAIDRLRVWSDFQCALRLCGGVAKLSWFLTCRKMLRTATFPSCLESFSVEEQTITRWIPGQSREDQTIAKRKSDGKNIWPHDKES